MPTVEFDGESYECEEGAVLRQVLLENDVTPHNPAAQGGGNCGGNASCGTCGVEIVEGEENVNDMEDKEEDRLSMPPLSTDLGLRLACQVEVNGDIKVVKHPGYFGEKVDE